MKYIDSDIIYSSVTLPGLEVSTGPLVIANSRTVEDVDGEKIISNINDYGLLYNAIDIDWNGAEIDGVILKTTSDLLRWIKSKSSGGSSSGGSGSGGSGSGGNSSGGGSSGNSQYDDYWIRTKFNSIENQLGRLGSTQDSASALIGQLQDRISELSQGDREYVLTLIDDALRDYNFISLLDDGTLVHYPMLWNGTLQEYIQLVIRTYDDGSGATWSNIILKFNELKLIVQDLSFETGEGETVDITHIVSLVRNAIEEDIDGLLTAVAELTTSWSLFQLDVEGELQLISTNVSGFLSKANELEAFSRQFSTSIANIETLEGDVLSVTATANSLTSSMINLEDRIAAAEASLTAAINLNDLTEAIGGFATTALLLQVSDGLETLNLTVENLLLEGIEVDPELLASILEDEGLTAVVEQVVATQFAKVGEDIQALLSNEATLLLLINSDGEEIGSILTAVSTMKSEVLGIQSSLNLKATSTDVANTYATKTALAQLQTQVTGINSSLSLKATSSDVANTYATKTALAELTTTVGDVLSSLALKATKQELNGYATSTALSELQSSINSISAGLSNYITSTTLNNYATKTYVDGEVSNAILQSQSSLTSELILALITSSVESAVSTQTASLSSDITSILLNYATKAMLADGTSIKIAGNTLSSKISNIESTFSNYVLDSEYQSTKTAFTTIKNKVNNASSGLDSKASQSQVTGLSEALASLTSEVEDASSGLSTKASQNLVSGLSEALTTLLSKVNNASTGLDSKASVDRVTLVQNAVTTISSTINDPQTGLNTKASLSVAVTKDANGYIDSSIHLKANQIYLTGQTTFTNAIGDAITVKRLAVSSTVNSKTSSVTINSEKIESTYGTFVGFRVNKDGSGMLANGKISWTSAGAVTIDNDVSVKSLSASKVITTTNNTSITSSVRINDSIIESLYGNFVAFRVRNTGEGSMANGKIYWDSSGNVTITAGVSVKSLFATSTVSSKTSTITVNSSKIESKWDNYTGFLVNADGSGSLAGGKISWTNAGAVTVDSAVTVKSLSASSTTNNVTSTVTVNSNKIELKNGSFVSFIVNKDGSGMLSGGRISWDNSGACSLGGGKILLNADGSVTVASSVIVKSLSATSTVSSKTSTVTINANKIESRWGDYVGLLVNANGSGSLAGGAITWDNAGNLTVGESVTTTRLYAVNNDNSYVLVNNAGIKLTSLQYSGSNPYVYTFLVTAEGYRLTTEYQNLTSKVINYLGYASGVLGRRMIEWECGTATNDYNKHEGFSVKINDILEVDEIELGNTDENNNITLSKNSNNNFEVSTSTKINGGLTVTGAISANSLSVTNGIPFSSLSGVAPVRLLSSENLNTITTSGFYYGGGGNSSANKPANASSFGLITIRSAEGSYGKQILYSTNDGKLYHRSYSPTTFYDWYEVFLTDTKNTAGATLKNSNQLYLVGVTSTGSANAVTYTNSNVYINSSNVLCTSGIRVNSGDLVLASLLIIKFELSGNSSCAYIKSESDNTIRMASPTAINIEASGLINLAAYNVKASAGLIELTSSTDFRSNRALNVTSDERLKTITNSINLSVEDIASTRIVDFTYKDDPNSKVKSGCIAQDWQKILPNVVSEDKNNNLGLEYESAALISSVVAAREIVLLKQIIALLQEKITMLEANKNNC